MTRRYQQFREALNNRPLIGDGALGTELLRRGMPPNLGLETANLSRGELVEEIHRHYLRSGSQVIETNTFAANPLALAQYEAETQLTDILQAGVRLAQKAADQKAFVAGAFGPLPNREGEPLPEDEQFRIFSEIGSVLLETGVDLVLLETFVELPDLLTAIHAIRSLSNDIPIVAQMAFERNGKTGSGDNAQDVLQRCQRAGADVVGANCGAGIPAVLSAVQQMLPGNAAVSAYLNAGYPESVEGRKQYLASDDYLAQQALKLREWGVALIGGCCGTTPATIARIADQLSVKPSRTTARQSVPSLSPIITEEKPPEKSLEIPSGEVSESLALIPSGVLVEIDPPNNLEFNALLDRAIQLKEAGADWLTVADNPLASARTDNLSVAALLQQQTDLPVIPHLTGRDRNRIALQSTIMGAHMWQIPSLLCVTGDPVRMYHETNTSGVFDLTSIGLVKLVMEFNQGKRTTRGNRTSFSIGVAVNPNVRNIESQVAKLQRKADSGASYALSQPIYDKNVFDRMNQAMTDINLKLPVFVGIMPLPSYRTAEFLHNEVPGIVIPDPLRQQLGQYNDPADQYRVGLEQAQAIIEQISGTVDGYYLMLPGKLRSQTLEFVRETSSKMHYNQLSPFFCNCCASPKPVRRQP